MFGHLKKLGIADREAWLELPEIAPKARIKGRPANDSNAGYFNAMMKRTGKQIRHLARGGRMTAEHFAENREVDTALYPIHVFTDWEGIIDEHGAEVTFSREAAKEFAQQVNGHAPYLMDRIRNFFAQPESFLEEDEEEAPDAEVLAGNSESGSSGN